VTTLPEDLEGHTKVVSLWRDVTDRRAAEEALQRAVVDTLHHAAQLRGLSEAALAISAALSVDEVWHVTTNQARAIIGAHHAITSLTVTQEWAQVITAISVSDTCLPWRSDDNHPDESSLYALVCRDNDPMYLTQEKLEAHPAWHGFGWAKDTNLPMRGWLAAPLIGRDGRNMGLIQLSNKIEGKFTENDAAITTQLAHLASNAIENARLYAIAQQAEVELQRQLQFTSAITDRGEGVYAVDCEGRVAFMNPAAESFLGWTKQELAGKQSHDFIHFQGADGLPVARQGCNLLSVIQGEELLRRGEDVFTRRDASTFPVAYASSSIMMDEEVLGAVVASQHTNRPRRPYEKARSAIGPCSKITLCPCGYMTAKL
jgi:PAS domain S-box-containing protein